MQLLIRIATARLPGFPSRVCARLISSDEYPELLLRVSELRRPGSSAAAELFDFNYRKFRFTIKISGFRLPGFSVAAKPLNYDWRKFRTLIKNCDVSEARMPRLSGDFYLGFQKFTTTNKQLRIFGGNL